MHGEPTEGAAQRVEETPPLVTLPLYLLEALLDLLGSAGPGDLDQAANTRGDGANVEQKKSLEEMGSACRVIMAWVSNRLSEHIAYTGFNRQT